MFFGVLLVSFSLFRPGIVRAPFLVTILYRYYILYIEEIKAKELIKIYIREVFIRYRVLNKIILLLFVLFIARCGPFSRSMQAYTFYLQEKSLTRGNP